MEPKEKTFNEKHLLHELRHYLPSQAPLKDFIHHNTLHAFQNLKFPKALTTASEIFGYRVTLSLHEYRQLYRNGTIREDVLDRILKEQKGEEASAWKLKLTQQKLDHKGHARIGELRKAWKRVYNFDLELEIQPLLFRLLCSYLDQGISISAYPLTNYGFLRSVKELQNNSFVGIFKSKRVIQILESGNYTMESLLKLLVGDPAIYEQYIFDQQFAHQGWSGMAAYLEEHPNRF
jgi:uncharacterized protein